MATGRHLDPDYQKKYRAANKEKRKAYLLANKEKISARAKERAMLHYQQVEAAKEFTPEYYDNQKKIRAAANKKWREKNKEKVKAWKRASYHRNKEKINSKRRKNK